MIEVRSSPIEGRGVFATQALSPGAPFHTAELLIFDLDEYPALQQTRAAHYVFHVSDDPAESGKSVTGLAMSRISFINHARPANCSFQVDADTSTVSFAALRDIAAGEELTIDYGDFAEKLGLPG